MKRHSSARLRISLFFDRLFKRRAQRTFITFSEHDDEHVKNADNIDDNDDSLKQDANVSSALSCWPKNNNKKQKLIPPQ